MNHDDLAAAFARSSGERDNLDRYIDATATGETLPPVYQAVVDQRATCADHEAFAICLHTEQGSYQECWEATCRR